MNREHCLVLPPCLALVRPPLALPAFTQAKHAPQRASAALPLYQQQEQAGVPRTDEVRGGRSIFFLKPLHGPKNRAHVYSSSTIERPVRRSWESLGSG